MHKQILPKPSAQPYWPVAVASIVLVNFAVFGLVALAIVLHGGDAPVIWYANLCLFPSEIRFYTPFTHLILHEDVLHLALNMLLLWVFGSTLEPELGWRRFLLFYVSAGALAGLLQAGMALLAGGAERSAPILGASGAVSALVGLYSVRLYRSRVAVPFTAIQIPAFVVVAFVVAGEIAAAMQSTISAGGGSIGVAHWAHLGGFTIGAGWALITRQARSGEHAYLALDADAALLRGEAGAAIQKLERLTAHNPLDLESRAQLARAWADLGDITETRAACVEAMLGWMELGNRKAVAELYVDLLRRLPELTLPPDCLSAVASGLEDQGLHTEAIQTLDVLTSLYGGTQDAEMAALRACSLTWRKLRNGPAAAARFIAFLEAFPQSTWEDYVRDQLRGVESSTREGP